MRNALLLVFAWAMQAQTCLHQVTRSPIGPVLVYQNGALLKQGVDFLYATVPGAMPTITPLRFALGDQFAVVFSRQVPLSVVSGGTTVNYVSFQNWQEIWACSGGNTVPISRPAFCKFTNPPVNPQKGDTCIFTDANVDVSCRGGGPGNETCVWDGGQWKSTSVPIVSSLFSAGPATSRYVECAQGLVKTDPLSLAQNQEVLLFTVDGSTRWDQVLISEMDAYPNMGATVSMGRPGTNHLEMTGAPVPLGVSSQLAAAWTGRPNPPQLSGQYSVVLDFEVPAGHTVSELAGGSVHWEACGYRIGSGVAPAAARLGSVQSCSGSGNSIGGGTWNCAGAFRASIQLADGTSLSLVGVDMPNPEGPGHWTDR